MTFHIQHLRPAGEPDEAWLEEERAASTASATAIAAQQAMPAAPAQCPPPNSARRITGGTLPPRQPQRILLAARSAGRTPLKAAMPNPALHDAEERDTTSARSHELDALSSNSRLDRSLAERPDPLKFHTIFKLEADVRKSMEARQPGSTLLVRRTRLAADEPEEG